MITTVYLLLAALTLATPLPRVPLAPHAGTLRIAVVGDTGEGSDRVAHGIARLNARMRLDAIVITGDAFYPCGPKSATDPQWDRARALSQVGVPLLPVLGNHDFCGKSVPDAQIGATTVPHWQFPARQYVVESKIAELLMLDTTPFAAGRNEDAADAIRALPLKKTTWRIVAGHHPVVSSGYHGHFPRDQHHRMVTIEPLLKRAHVDLYLCGHDHHLELIDGSPRFLISGAGSDPIPPIVPHAKTLYPSEATAQLGFAVVELDAHTMTIRFFDGDGKAISRAFVFRR